MKENSNNIANNIRNQMAVSHINQLELAKLLDCSNTTISMWINGKSVPRIDKIDKMCEIFGCKREDLISDTVKSAEDILQDQIVLTFAKDFKELRPEQQLRVIAFMRQLKEENDGNKI